MTLYVCDTHALIWRLLDDRRLGNAACAAFDSADAGTATMHIPAVFLAEMIMIAEKQRVVGWTRSEVELLVDAVSDASNYVLTELTPMLVLRSAELPIVPDIFDRLIAWSSQDRSDRHAQHQRTLGRAHETLTRHGEMRSSGDRCTKSRASDRTLAQLSSARDVMGHNASDAHRADSASDRATSCDRTRRAFGGQPSIHSTTSRVTTARRALRAALRLQPTRECAPVRVGLLGPRGSRATGRRPRALRQ